MTILEHGPDGLADYMTIPISFLVTERFGLPDERLIGPYPVPRPWLKDYDAFEEDRPVQFPTRFDVANWGFFAVMAEDRRIASASLVYRSPDFDLLEGREDLAHVADFRVHPDFWGQGVGRLLWNGLELWAMRKGATEIRVETQDVNVPACKFYQAMGCQLHSFNSEVYGPKFDEVQLIWGKSLSNLTATAIPESTATEEDND